MTWSLPIVQFRLSTRGPKVYTLGVQQPFPLGHGVPPRQVCPCPRNAEGGLGRIRCLGAVCKAFLWSAPANPTISLISILGSDLLLANFSFQQQSQNCQKGSNISAFYFLVGTQGGRKYEGFKNRKFQGWGKVHILAYSSDWLARVPDQKAPSVTPALTMSLPLGQDVCTSSHRQWDQTSSGTDHKRMVQTSLAIPSGKPFF